MTRCSYRRGCGAVLLIALAVAAVSGCGAFRGFRGANSLPLPGRVGVGPGSYTIQAQMPDVQNLKENSRVQFNDVLIGNVTKVERQGWHALVTMSIEPDAGAAGQCNRLGRSDQPAGHITRRTGYAPRRRGEGQAAQRISDPAVVGERLPVYRADAGGGVAGAQWRRSGSASGHHRNVEHRLHRSRKRPQKPDHQLDKFTAYLNDQKDDIIAALDSLNNLVGQVAEQKPVLDKALKTIPGAVTVLRDERGKIADSLGRLPHWAILPLTCSIQPRRI